MNKTKYENFTNEKLLNYSVSMSLKLCPFSNLEHFDETEGLVHMLSNRVFIGHVAVQH